MTDIATLPNQPLQIKITEYGLRRIAEALVDTSLNLRLSKIKFGSGDNSEYYTPSETQTSLRGPIPEAEFYVYKKELLEDKLTISFYTILPENIGGFDIREVGLYEDVNGEDKLFAIGTCKPFVKPVTAENYFISVDYYIFLKAADLSKVFERIVLDAENAAITDADLEELMRTFLFSNANLINQIGNNSRIIGYNRTTQLYEKINNNKTSFSYLTLYKNYASLMEMVKPDSIFSYWAFDYSRRSQTTSSIVDLSTNANFLSTTVPVSNIEKVYRGFMSMFKMQNANFFLSPSIPVRLYEGDSDIPFVAAFAINPLSTESRTLMAKSDYKGNTHVFEFNELSDGSIQVKFFTDNDNFIVFISNPGVVPQSLHSLVLSYDPEQRKFITYINSTRVPMIIDTENSKGTYTHMQELPSELYAFSCSPSYSAYANSNISPTIIYNEDGTEYYIDEDSPWQIENNKLYYEGNEASPASIPPNTKFLYQWKYEDSESTYYVYTLVAPVGDNELPEGVDVQLYNSEWELYEGTSFYVNGNKICYNESTKFATATGNAETRELYTWRYTAPEAFIYANSVEEPTRLYVYNDEQDAYTGTDWTIENNKIYYLGQEATHRPEGDTRSTYPPLTSYITDSSDQIAQPINSEVGIITIVKDKMEEEKVKAFSLLLCATMGINPYMGT